MSAAGSLIRVLVVDDESPARAKLRRWLGEQPDMELVAEAQSGLMAAQLIAATRPDLVFLDIQMPGMSGLEVAAQLQPETAPLLVFVTAHDDHAVEAFDLDAVDYLLKPYDRSRFVRSLTRIRARLADGTRRAEPVAIARARIGHLRRLLVPDGAGLRLLDTSAILWLEADDNYVHVHITDREFLLRRTLQDLLQQLGEEHFARIHRSTAVNVAEIAGLDPLAKGDYEVRLRNGTRLRLSRRFASALLERGST